LIPSPCLKYGPQVQLSQSEYIFLDGVGSQKRGRFEMCFIEIGAWYSVGATIGTLWYENHGMKIVLINKETHIYKTEHCKTFYYYFIGRRLINLNYLGILKLYLLESNKM